MKRFFAPLFSALTYSRAAYLLLGLPLGTLYFVFLVTFLSVGFGLVIVWVGLLILPATVLIWRGIGVIERALSGALLDEPIDPPRKLELGGLRFVKKVRAILADSYTWRSLAWLLLRFPLGIAGFVLTVVLFSVTVGLLAAPVGLYFDDLISVESEVWWIRRIPDWLVWLVPVLGVFTAGASAHIISGFGRLQGIMARPLLGPSEREQRVVLERRTEVLEERTELAHELHDSVGHTLTMMVVQAGAAGHVFDSDPRFAREALGNIETSGRQALGELDRILGLLREDHDGDRSPPSDLLRVPDLVEQMENTGLEIRFVAEGSLEQVPNDLSRLGYRIVQEALTNVLKHAGPVEAELRIHRTAGAVEIEVRNERNAVPVAGSPSADLGGGRGLAGIRERVGAVGGSVEAGPRPDGGFRVWVRLPIE